MGAIVLLAVGIAAYALAAVAPVHHALDVRLDPGARTLEGRDRVSLHATGSVAFKLGPGFSIDHLVVDDRPVEVRPRGGRITLGEGSEHAVVIEYRGRLGPLPQAGEVVGPVAGTEGSYLPAGWFPTFGGLFDYEVTIDVPDSQRALAPGRLTAETTARGRYQATFTGVAPVQELPLFAGPYRVSERIHRGWRLRTYFHAADADLADTYLDRTADYLDLYDGWIGAYPYPGFSIVSSPLPVGLAFPGITYLGTRVLRLPFIPDTSLGHEVLHSWWGDGVRVDGRDGNWAEGLTTFMADYTFAERRGAEAARDQRLAWLREFAILPAVEDRPLDSFRGRMHTASQATGYHKAAFVFEMLRDEIGPDAFATGVRRFWQAHRLRAATWRDLEAAYTSAASGRSLTTFFTQWVRRPGAPRLGLGGVEPEPGRVSFTLTQDEPAYALGVPVVVETADEPVARTVHLAEASRGYAIDVTAAPRALAVDPDLRLFRRLDPAEVPPILREVAFDTTAEAVVAATEPAARSAALELATSFFEREPGIVEATDTLPAHAVLVVGTTKEVTALLARAQVGAVPPGLAGKGTARVWAARRADRAPLAVASADGAGALRAIARPLPHYGGQSFIVFSGSEAVEKGLWPPGPSPLRVTLPTRSPS
jgi:aminopeptidase N